MIYTRVESETRGGWVEEIIVPAHESALVWEGLNRAIQAGVRAGEDPVDIDMASAGAQAIEHSRRLLFGGAVVLRGRPPTVDTVARFIDASGIVGEDPAGVRLAERQMTYRGYLETADQPTDFFNALYVDLSPFAEGETIMPPNATTLHAHMGTAVLPKDLV